MFFLYQTTFLGPVDDFYRKSKVEPSPKVPKTTFVAHSLQPSQMPSGWVDFACGATQALQAAATATAASVWAEGSERQMLFLDFRGGFHLGFPIKIIYRPQKSCLAQEKRTFGPPPPLIDVLPSLSQPQKNPVTWGIVWDPKKHFAKNKVFNSNF